VYICVIVFSAEILLLMNQSDNLEVPILSHKNYNQPSVFTAENLLREARRQKELVQAPVPPICVLDPDGDLVDYLQATGQAHRSPTWACYHTTLYIFVHEEIEYGIIGRVVGAPFAVLVAEELFAADCQLLISITSAGQISAVAQPPYIILIDKALRDEGTSYHYLPPSSYSFLVIVHGKLSRLSEAKRLKCPSFPFAQAN
jgi:hypothetical protein